MQCNKENAMKIKYLLIGCLVLVAAVALVACQPAPAPAPAETSPPPEQPAQVCPTAEPCPSCPECPAPVVAEVPYEEQWAASPHNDAAAEAFVHWNEDDPAEVPTSCARCHSTSGYQDYLGADGSEAGTVDAAVPVGETINCNACHNPAADSLSEVTFPSGVTVTGLGPEARCMVCHQGRASSVQVNDQITEFNATDLDAVVPPLDDGSTFGFINVHYFPAAATLYGGQVMGGYQYEGKAYDSKNDHVEGYATCIGCHNQHTLQVKVEECAACHEGVTTAEDLQNVRMVSSAPDYDGDGDVEEGMFFELQGLQEILYGAIQSYATDVAGTGIVYDVAAHPYFFVDADGDGTADQGDEGNLAYNAWTPRLLKAAYNYQLSQKDPGKHAHGNKYIVQLLYDSIEDLNAALPTPVDMTAMHRDDAGHFAGNTEPFRHWDAEGGVVPNTCVKCHTATGLPMFIANAGSTIAAPASNGFLCSTCHDPAAFPARYTVDDVTFPSGATLTFGEGENSNLCIMCHQGRESKASVDRAIGEAASSPDTVAVDEEGAPTLRFRNIHYFAAGATLFGTEAQGAYEYDGKTYAGRNEHPLAKCTDCHDAHKLAPKLEACTGCHGDTEPENIRGAETPDYDGDGDTTEGVKGELDTMAEQLYAALQAYTVANGLPGLVYDSVAYPYFFEDADGDGAADEGEEGPVSYTQWTPTLLRAAYNYQYYQKDPGAFAHNSQYVAQILYDSIEDVGGSVSGMTRP
jgi:hypothetical protein